MGSALSLRGGVDNATVVEVRQNDGALVTSFALSGNVFAGGSTFAGPVVGSAYARFGDVFIGAGPSGASVPQAVSAVAGSALSLRGGVSTGIIAEVRDSGGVLLARFDPAGTAVGGTTTVLTAEKGNALYPTLAAGGTLAGPLIGTSARFGDVFIGAGPSGVAAPLTVSAAAGSALTLRGGVDAGIIAEVRQNDSTLVARFDPAGPAAAGTTTVITQEKGNALYLALAGGTLTGTVTGTVARFGDYFIGGDTAGAANAGLISRATAAGAVLRAGTTTGILHQFQDSAGTVVASANVAGTGAPQTHTIITREKGDTRFAAASSLRFKEALAPRSQASLLAVFDALVPFGWIWGGELPQTDERYGTPGVGFGAEDVEPVYPEAVRYQWVSNLEDDEGNPLPTPEKQVLGLDPLALIAVLHAKITQQEERIATLEATP